MNKSIKKYFPLFALPTLVAFTIGFIIPFAMGIYLSFCKFTTVTDAKFVGLSNYTKIFGDETFVHSLWYTALFTIVSVLAINFFAFVIAMLLTKGIRGTNAFRTIFFMPNLIGGIVLGYIWQLIFNGILANYSRTLAYNEKYGYQIYLKCLITILRLNNKKRIYKEAILICFLSAQDYNGFLTRPVTILHILHIRSCQPVF